MIEGRFEMGAKGLKETAYMRSMVFTEELGMAAEVEQDAYDNFAYHLIVEDGGDKVGTGRLIYKDGEYLIGRIAVPEAGRGNGYGDLIVRMLCDKAFSLGADEVVIHSQPHVVDFYKRIGFVEKGEFYKEAGLDHITMKVTQKSFSHPCSGCGGC